MTSVVGWLGQVISEVSSTFTILGLYENAAQRRLRGLPLGTTEMSPEISQFGVNFGSSLRRKVRGEAKKCRKVYGIEHRDQWCTACRWKKACQRFLD